MFYAILAKVVCIAKLTKKYILLKYNCTWEVFLVAVVVYIIKQLFYSLSSHRAIADSVLTNEVNYDFMRNLIIWIE